MDSTLFITPALSIDGKAQTAEDILLNRSRVVDWYENTDDTTVFYYKISDDKKDKAIEIKSQYPILQFETVFNETTANKFIVVNVNKINKNCKSYKIPVAMKADSVISKLHITVNSIVWGRTIGSYQYLWIERSAGNYVVIETSDSLAEINGTVSASGSIN